MPKRILSWLSKFIKFLETYLLARSIVLHFSAKKESVNILEMTNFWRNNLAIFHKLKKKRFIFLMTHLFLMFVKMKFFKEYIEEESKIYFIIYKIFWMAQKNIAIVAFKQASITCTQIIRILHEPGNYRYSTLRGLTRLAEEFFNTYQRYFYFNYDQHTGQSKIFRNHYFT